MLVVLDGRAEWLAFAAAGYLAAERAMRRPQPLAQPLQPLASRRLASASVAMAGPCLWHPCPHLLNPFFAPPVTSQKTSPSVLPTPPAGGAFR